MNVYRSEWKKKYSVVRNGLSLSAYIHALFLEFNLLTSIVMKVLSQKGQERDRN